MRFLFIAVLVAVSGAAHAATFSVNSTADLARTSGTRACQCNAPLQPCTLRAAVQASNSCAGADTITLAAGATYVIASGTSEDYALSGDFDLRDPVTLLGNGATIDANNLDRAFELGVPGTGGAYVIRDLRVIHGIRDGGGFRLWDTGAGTLLANVTVEDASDAGVGGGVLIAGGELAIEHGAFARLTYGCGGGLAIDGARVSITDSAFEFDRATSCVGGAIYVLTPSTLTITTSSFFANSAFYRGGAIALLTGQSHVAIVDSSFASNSVDGMSFHGGGAIYSNGSVLTVASSAFTSNSAALAEGGALTLENTYATLTELDAGGNHSGNGGFAFITSNSLAIISKSSLHDNIAATGGSGGAIELVDAQLSLFDSELQHNNGHGAALALAGTADVTDVRITDSPQIAVVIGSGALVHLDRTSVGHTGAAGIETSGHLELTNATVFANAGGGLHVMGGDVAINNSTIVDNTASQGGGLDITGGTVELGNTIVARNTATWSADDIYGPYTDLGHNVIALAPRLGALTDASPVPASYALAAGSPARNAGDNATCEAVDIIRTVRPLGGTCDIGASERD